MSAPALITPGTIVEVPPTRLIPQCGNVFVINKNAKTVQVDPNDPYGTVQGVGSGDENCLVARNPGLPFLDLFLLISGATDSSTNVGVACFGFVPFRNGEQPPSYANQPFNYDPTNFDSPDGATFLGPTDPPERAAAAGIPGWWLPLHRPSDDANILSFSNTPQIDKDSTAGSSKRMKLISLSNDTPARLNEVYVGGCTHVVCLITTAAASATAAMILGRFRG